MIKIIFSLLLALTVTGCAHNFRPVEIDESRVRQVSLVAELASYNGTKLYLIDNPDKLWVFQNVSTNLSVLLDEETVPLDKFLTIIRSLPVRELNSEKGQLIVDNAVILFHAYSQDVIKLDQLEQAAKLRPVILAIKNGIDKGMR